MGRNGTGGISGSGYPFSYYFLSLSDHQEILKTNEELAEEVDKLYKSEDRILLERDTILEEVKSLRKETQQVREELLAEKQKQKVVIEKLNQENQNNLGTLVNPFASHRIRSYD